MPETLRDPTTGDQPPIDPDAIEEAYRLHRARRQARVQRRRSARRAGVRFWVVLLLLFVVSVVLAVTLWREVERLFGL
jgi:hypothetical protein